MRGGLGFHIDLISIHEYPFDNSLAVAERKSDPTCAWYCYLILSITVILPILYGHLLPPRSHINTPCPFCWQYLDTPVCYIDLMCTITSNFNVPVDPLLC